MTDKPKVVIFGDRLNDVGRLRQVIILKKEYGMVQELFNMTELFTHMANYIECILYKDPNTTTSSKYSVGPLLCGDTTHVLEKYKRGPYDFNTDPDILGLTITIYNLEECLKKYIIDNYCYTGSNPERTTYFIYDRFEKNDVKDLNNIILMGCSGGSGVIRRMYEHPTIEKNSNKIQVKKLNELSQLGLTNETNNCKAISNDFIYDDKTHLFKAPYVGSEEDSYMLILRFPITKEQSQSQNTDIAFGHPYIGSNTSGNTDNIMISNYVSKNNKRSKFLTNREEEKLSEQDTIFYRQIYYFIDKSSFSQLSDCGFWNFCSLNDYFSNRTEVFKIFPTNTSFDDVSSYLIDKKVGIRLEKIYQSNSSTSSTNVVTSPMHIWDNFNKNCETIININGTENTLIIPTSIIGVCDISKNIQEFITTDKPTFLIRQTAIETTKDLNQLLGKRISLKKIKMDRPYLNISDSDISFEIQEIITIGYKSNPFAELWFQIIPKTSFDIPNLDENETFYLYINNIEENTEAHTGAHTETHRVVNTKANTVLQKIKNDIIKFNPSIENINDNELLNNTELVRIWITVRFATTIYQDIILKKSNNTNNTIKSIILGNEAILVNPMTGRGVSNAIKSSYNFINQLGEAMKTSPETQAETQTQTETKNIAHLITKFDSVCQTYSADHFKMVCEVLNQGEEARTSKYERHNLTFL